MVNRCYLCLIVILLAVFNANGFNVSNLYKNCKVQKSDNFLESLVCKSSTIGHYRLTKNVVKNDNKRTIYNYLLNIILFGEQNDSEKAIKELLKTKADKHLFLDAIYKIRDSKIWTDGHYMAPYEILLDYKNFGDYGFSLANKGVVKLAQSCEIKLDILFLIEFVCDVRPEGMSTLKLIANCSIKSKKQYKLALVSAIGLARLGQAEEAEKLITKVEKLNKKNQNMKDIYRNMILKTKKLIKNLPKDWSELYQSLEDIFL